MKKTVLAVTLAALPLAAMADVTLYGKVKMAVETSMVSGQNGADDVTRTNIDDVGSRIGFKGTESLSSNLNAIWQVETALSMTGSRDGNGAASGSSFGKLRDSFVGLQSNDFGTLQVGRLSNFANTHQGIIDAWTYSQFPLGLSQFYNNQKRYDHAVRYTTPELSGFTAFVQYGQEESSAGKVVSSTNALDQANRAINGGIKFSTGPWSLTYGYEDASIPLNEFDPNLNDGVDALHDVVDHTVEGVYQANGFLLGLGYRNTAAEDGNYWKSFDKEQYAFTVAYEVDSWKPKFSYAHGDYSGKAQAVTNEFDYSYDQFIVGFDYALSKRTVIGSQFGYFDNELSVDPVQSLGVNVVHSF